MKQTAHPVQVQNRIRIVFMMLNFNLSNFVQQKTESNPRNSENNQATERKNTFINSLKFSDIGRKKFDSHRNAINSAIVQIGGRPIIFLQ